MATEAIQKAMDAAEAAGGGTVVVPKGTWMTGTIWLRSHVELHLDKGAVLKGSVHKEDYNANDAVLAASESPMPVRIDSAFAGEEYGTDIDEILSLVRQAAKEKKVFVLSSHGISPDAKGNNMKTEWLERILATAKECGLRAVGFDELP